MPPERDGCTFPRAHTIRQYQKTIDGNGNKHFIWRGIPGPAPVWAASNRHPARLHRVWAHAAVIGPEGEKR